MNLKLKDIVDILGVSEKTVYRWIKQDKIPAYKINGQYRFDEQEINEWISTNKMEVKVSPKGEADEKNINLARLIEKGGFYNISGENIREIIENSVERINLPPDITKSKLLNELIEREMIVPTGIGKGVAVPHPKNPIIKNLDGEQVCICFLDKEVEYNAMDGVPVHTLFIVLSSNPKKHVQILSKISFLCHEKEFMKLLKEKNRNKIIDYIDEKKEKWGKFNMKHLIGLAFLAFQFINKYLIVVEEMAALEYITL